MCLKRRRVKKRAARKSEFDFVSEFEFELGKQTPSPSLAPDRGRDQ